MMNGEFQVFKVEVGVDELGQQEELTWDLLPLINPEDTVHLDENGLPQIGTRVQPGMILLGKIGKSKAYENERKPTDLELHGMRFEELRESFGHLWVDKCTRVPVGTHGEVIESRIEDSDGRRVAIVRLKLSPPTNSTGEHNALRPTPPQPDEPGTT